MNILVVGASGHIGSYLVPRLVRDGHAVTAVSRGNRKAYNFTENEWKEVRVINAARAEFCENRALLNELKPDIICDLISYTVDEAKALCEHFIGSGTRLIQIGSIWIYAYKKTVPVTEEHERNEVAGYGKNKADIERYLLDLTARDLLDCTVIHPGHISGRGWLPINPQGNLNIGVYQAILDGSEITLPDTGMYTLHHVHSADIASLISLCIKKPKESSGQVFHAVAPEAMTFRGFAEMLYSRFGKEPKLRFLPWDEFVSTLSPGDADCTYDHVRHSPVCSMEKAKRVLGFTPRYGAFETILDALSWQIENGFLRA